MVSWFCSDHTKVVSSLVRSLLGFGQNLLRQSMTPRNLQTPGLSIGVGMLRMASTMVGLSLRPSVVMRCPMKAALRTRDFIINADFDEVFL